MKSNYKETWHVLHFILTVLFLPYGLLWILFTLSNNAHNRRVEHQEILDAMGRINTASNYNWKE